MCDFYVTSAAHALCGRLACQHIFQVFVAQKCVPFRKFLVSLETSDEHYLLFAVIPLNTPFFQDVPAAKNREY